MSFINDLSANELKKFSFIFNQAKKNMGFVPNSLKTMAHQPGLLSSFTMFSGLIIGDGKKVNLLSALKLTFLNSIWSLRFLKDKNRISLPLRNMISFVSSNAAGCKYCQAHTFTEAKINGATENQLNDIWNFENSTAFSDAEKAALRFSFAASSNPNSVNASHFEELKKHYSQKQIVEIGAVVALFGFLNRWNDSFATALEEKPKSTAEQFMKENGWELGKHK